MNYFVVGVGPDWLHEPKAEPKGFDWQVYGGNADYRALAIDSPLPEVAARLMQSLSVRLYHDQALFKEPGGGHTPWHQDQPYYDIVNVGANLESGIRRAANEAQAAAIMLTSSISTDLSTPNTISGSM